MSITRPLLLPKNSSKRLNLQTSCPKPLTTIRLRPIPLLARRQSNIAPQFEAEEEEGISEGEFIDLGTGVEWASCNLGATSPEQNPNFYACNDDAVKAELGTTLRLPTEDEIMALVDKCKWTWYEHNGVWGYRVASTITGKNIFLPAAGIYAAGVASGARVQGYYWIDNAGLDENATTARAFNFTQGWNNVFNSYPLYSGLSVRPVKK